MLGSSVRRSGIRGLSPALGKPQLMQQRPHPQWFCSARDLFAARVLCNSRGASGVAGSGESSARPREQGSTISSKDESLATHRQGNHKDLPLPGSGRETPRAGMGRRTVSGQVTERPENAPSGRKAFGSSRGAAALDSSFNNMHVGHSTRPYTLVQRSHEEVDQHAAMKRARANEQVALASPLPLIHRTHIWPQSLLKALHGSMLERMQRQRPCYGNWSRSSAPCALQSDMSALAGGTSKRVASVTVLVGPPLQLAPTGRRTPPRGRCGAADDARVVEPRAAGAGSNRGAAGGGSEEPRC